MGCGLLLVVCFRARDCPKSEGRDLCFNCWQPGHLARDCKSASRAPPASRSGGRDFRRSRSRSRSRFVLCLFLLWSLIDSLLPILCCRSLSPRRSRSPRRSSGSFTTLFLAPLSWLIVCFAVCAQIERRRSPSPSYRDRSRSR